MKACNNKDLGVNGHRCRLPTSPSICLLRCVLPSETALRTKSSLWMGLQKWQMWVTKRLPCCTICPRAFAPWHLHMVSIRKFITWDCQQAFKVWFFSGISIRVWTKWHGQQAFKAWLSVGILIRALTTWHGQQAFKAWLLARVSIRALITWHGQQAFKASLLATVSIRALTV